MKFKKITYETKARLYNVLKCQYGAYIKFRELTKADNKYTRVDIDKFKYHPLQSNGERHVWSYDDIIIEELPMKPFVKVYRKVSARVNK